ncbi:hypothetical protein Hanom_Chr12g01082691 [Helianthus anomalus]
MLPRRTAGGCRLRSGTFGRKMRRWFGGVFWTMKRVCRLMGFWLGFGGGWWSPLLV